VLGFKDYLDLTISERKILIEIHKAQMEKEIQAAEGNK
jgi:hypothetical protein